MGSGDFGSNGSVFWVVRHTNGAGGGGGNDPMNYEDIGNGDGVGHLGKFRIKLKFPDETSARAALGVAEYTGQGFVTILVPKTSPKRDVPGQPEVSVDW